MIVTARQLEDLHRQGGSNGHVTVPYRARLSPLAADWIRAKKIVLGYADVPADSAGAAPTSTPIAKTQAAEPASSPAGGFLWWCDGPCGPAKAAVMAHAKESNLRPLDKPADAKQLVSVIKMVASEVKAARVHGAVLLVQNGALATIFANRCPSLRAVLGTCIESVEQGVQQAAANVLIIEHPYKTLQQVRNLLLRFTRGMRELPEEVKRQLQDLASCP
jgi:ribose 5-phosphate isomerase RpiB